MEFDSEHQPALELELEPQPDSGPGTCDTIRILLEPGYAVIHACAGGGYLHSLCLHNPVQGVGRCQPQTQDQFEAQFEAQVQNQTLSKSAGKCAQTVNVQAVWAKVKCSTKLPWFFTGGTGQWPCHGAVMVQSSAQS